MIKLRYLPLISLITVHGGLFADQFSAEGLVSIGYLAADKNRFLTSDDGGDSLLSENILRLTYTTDFGLSVSGQLLYRKAGDYVDDEPVLDFLQLDYRGNWFGEGEQALSLGRFKIRQGLYNQSRDISFTRPSILLPQAVYLDNTRNFALSADGAELSGYVPFETSDLSWSLAIGESIVDTEFSAVALSPTASGRWDSDTNFYAHLQWESQQVTLGSSYSEVGLTYSPDSNAFIPVTLPNNTILQLPLIQGSFDGNFLTLSFQYREENWEFTSEWVQRDIQSAGFSNPDDRIDAEIDGYYAQYRYFITETLVLSTRYDVMEFDSNLQEVRRAPDEADEATDIMLGISWQLDESWLITLEHHFIDGAGWVPPFNKTSAFTDFSKRWQLSAAQLSYKF